MREKYKALLIRTQVALKRINKISARGVIDGGNVHKARWNWRLLPSILEIKTYEPIRMEYSTVKWHYNTAANNNNI